MRVRRNSLDARSPEILHPTRSGKWPGVFTSGEEIIAESYAQNGAWNLDRVKSWPVVFALDMHGLTQLLDPSGAQWKSNARYEIEYLAKTLAKGGSVYDAEMMGDGPQHESTPGMAWALAHRESGEESQTSLAAAILRVADGDAAEKLAARIVKDNEIPDHVANAAVNQYRYMDAVKEERVLAVWAVRPWWNPLLSGENEETEEAAEIVEAAGYQVFSDTDYSISPSHDFGKKVNRVMLYDSKRAGRRREYHGTVADLAARAFPFIAQWPAKPPFVVRTQSEVWDEIAEKDLEGAFG